MIKSTASKVMWVGRATVFLVGLAVILALVFGIASSALGANGDGFILGKAANTATKVTGLVGKVATGSALVVKNPSGGSALDLSVGDPAADPSTKTVAPMKVNSQKVVTNLNTDQLDGLESANLMPGGTLPAGATIRGKYEIDGTATAANELFDGDSISFGYTLPSTPETKIFRFEGTQPPECPGSATFPQADPGFLCVYEAQNSNLSTTETYPIVYDPTPFGANIYAHSAAAGVAYSYGSWAVTAPTAAQAQTLAQQDSSGSSQARQEP